MLEVGDDAEALPLEALVADREHLVEQQDVGVEERGDREAEPHRHPRRVRPHGPVDRVLDLGEGDDLVEPFADLAPAEPLDRPVEEEVLAAGEVGVEARPELEERADAAGGLDRPAGRLDDPGDDAEQRRLPRAVPADQADRLAGVDVGRDAVERPHLLRARATAGDDELLQGRRLAGADDEPPRDLVDADLAGTERAHDPGSRPWTWATRRVRSSGSVAGRTPWPRLKM